MVIGVDVDAGGDGGVLYGPVSQARRVANRRAKTDITVRQASKRFIIESSWPGMEKCRGKAMPANLQDVSGA